MVPASMDVITTPQLLSADPLPFARCYQLEALERAIKQNTIVYLETGSGKTLIAIMLLRSYAYLLRKPSPYVAVFLVPRVVLVIQQAEAIKMHTDFKVGMYWGEMGVDFWDAATWKEEIAKHEVLVMTPQILLNGLRHSFFSLSMIKVLILDECHHTRGKHPYACIMTEFYHCQLQSGESDLPRIFGMTASPIKFKGTDTELSYWQKIEELETLMHSKVYTCASVTERAQFIPFSTPKFKFYKFVEIPNVLYVPLADELNVLQAEGNTKNLKQTACLEACKQLHQIGALTDNLVPDSVVEEADAKRFGNEPYNDDQPIYFPPELTNESKSKEIYHCYLIELKQQNFNYDVAVHDIVLSMRTELDSDIVNAKFDLEVDRGTLTINLKYVGVIQLTPDQVLVCRKFQITLFRILMDHNLKKLTEILNGFQLENNLEIDYLLLPSTSSHQQLIDWKSVASVHDNIWKDHVNCSLKGNAHVVQTKSGPLCTCIINNSLVCTPHNGYIYCVTGFLDLNANSLLMLRDGGVIPYKEYYEVRVGIQLLYDKEFLLKGRHIFTMHNYLNRCRKQKEREPSKAFVELPPELCQVIMSPISLSTLYSFTFVPSIMYRLQSLLLAVNLKKMLIDHRMQSVTIPTIKVLEAMTTKECQEDLHLESLETLGDSFLKYTASQHLFKIYQSYHEGLLTIKKEKIISNAALCKLGCDHKLPGFIRDEPFDPKGWIIPCDNSGSYPLNDEMLSNGKKIYVIARRKLKSKRVADVVEALIGAFLSAGGENAAILFLNRIGINVDLLNVPYTRHLEVPVEMLVNLHHFQLLLNYSFREPSLLVEALTHASYMHPEIPTCYQRLEFLGDAVLDYLITIYLVNKYPRLSPELITDMRSASVNNDCYAHSAIKHEFHKHILYLSQELHKQIIVAVNNFQKLSLESTFGWESETSVPKVLGDVIESLAGAIYVDSGYNKDAVFLSIRPLLEPLVTPETVRFHPVKEFNEFCQKQHFDLKKSVASQINGTAAVTVEVKANGATLKHTATAADKKTAKRVACKEVLKSLKESISRT